MIPIRTSVEVQEIPGAVIGLIIANVVVFLVQSGLPTDLAEQFIYHNALVPARYTQPEFASELGLDPGNFLPILTNSFMHGGWLHLIVNMWTLWIFGRALEERLGAPRFVLFYLACGVIASLAHFAFNFYSPVPALGASGAIAGILGGYSLLYPRARIVLVTPVLFFPITYHLPAAVYTAIWFVIQVLQGVAELFAPGDTGGIAWWAHIGGFLAGLALIRLVGMPRHQVRRIGSARTGVQEIGAQHSRVRIFGSERRRLQMIGVSKRREGMLPTPTQRRPRAFTRPGGIMEQAKSALRKLREDAVRTASAASTDAPKEARATTSGRQRSPWSSVDRTWKTGRSIIPESGITKGRGILVLALIDRMLSKYDISESTREELLGYKEDIRQGEFDEQLEEYLHVLEARLSMRQ